MKFYLLTILLVPFVNLKAVSIDSIISQGVVLHDKGNFRGAIALFKQALDIDSLSYQANYEMSYSLFALKQNDSSLKYAEKATHCTTTDGSSAYLQWGMLLDIKKKPDQVIRIYKEGIAHYSSSCLLYNSLATAYINKALFDSALQTITVATHLTKNHPSTYFTFATLSYKKGNLCESMLGFMYFLLLDSKSERADNARKCLSAIWNSLAKRKDAKNYIISLPSQSNEDKKNAFTLGIAASIANRMAPAKEDNYTFAYNTIRESAELAGNLHFADYTTFYAALVNKEYVEVFARILAKQFDPEQGEKWIRDNSRIVSRFSMWFNGEYSK